MSPLALATVFLSLAATSQASASEAPLAFIEQSPPIGGFTKVLLLDQGGEFPSLVSNVQYRHDIPRLKLSHGYRLYCGRWRTSTDGKLQVVNKLDESFSFAAPADAGSRRSETFLLSGVLGSKAARLSLSGSSYAATSALPFDAGRINGIRLECDSVRARDFPAGR